MGKTSKERMKKLHTDITKKLYKFKEDNVVLAKYKTIKMRNRIFLCMGN